MVTSYIDSTLGTVGNLVESHNIPIPSGNQADDIALCLVGLHRAGTALTNFQWPADFNAITLAADDTEHKVRAAWHRLPEPESGNYTVTWTNAHYVQGTCILIRGALSTADPIDDSDSVYTPGGVSDTTVTTTLADFLAHFIVTSFGMTATPATNFTEVEDDGNTAKAYYYIPGSSGNYTATGMTTSSGGNNWTALIAVKPDVELPNEGSSTDKTITWAGSATGTSLTAPGNFTATVAGPYQINLDWDAVAGAVGYHVYRDDVLVHATTDTAWNDTGLDPSTEYCYRVAATQ